MLAFVNANLIDGTGSAPVAGTTVLVDGERIATVDTAVGATVGAPVGAGASAPAVPAGATVIDLKGKTLLPGLIDSHSHLGGRDYPPGLDNAKNSFDYAPMRDYALASGVTTIRSCGDFLHDTVGTRDKINGGALRGPRLICSGKSFQRKDAHPSRTIWGNDPETCENAGAYPGTPEQARELVRELVAAGVDYIKIIVADSFLFIYPERIEPLADDVMEAIIDEAHKLGKWVMCHIDSAPDAIKLIGYGADEINHLISMGIAELPDEADYDRLFELMVAKGTWFVPTITVVRTYNHIVLEKGAPATIDEYFIPHYKRAYEAGLRMGCGCDSGAPAVLWGSSLHAELKEYVYNLGMSPLEAIKCATQNNAIILGIDDKVGTIKEGMLADLLIVDGDPSKRIDDLDAVSMVFREGSIVVDNMLA
jgi:imidazolonepropionase-like amidohydrolase